MRIVSVLMMVFMCSVVVAKPPTKSNGDVKKVEKPAKLIPDKDWTDKLKVTLARSCVGEAGFESHVDKECVAMAYIYYKIHKRSKVPYLRVLLRYSAAVKFPSHWKRRPWLPQLDLDGNRPKSWPKTMLWHKKFKSEWIAILDQLESWRNGYISDPVPKAVHYGGAMDTKNPAKYNWVKLSTPDFKNYFYAPGKGRPAKTNKVFKKNCSNCYN